MMLELLFPRKCILCRRVLEREELDLCHQCRIDAPECPHSRRKLPFLDSWAAVWYYEDKVRESLLRYKFQGLRSYAPAYGRLLAMRLLKEENRDYDVVTWVPISKRRKFRRGFDQVEELTIYVARELGVPGEKLVEKIRHNKAQSGIVGDAQRRANVLGAYKVMNPARVAGKRILLLDDIVTTGSTAAEVSRVLLTAGAAEVHFGAVAAARHDAKK